MSILIKGMEMPKTCGECELRNEEENHWGDIVSITCPIIGEDVEDYGWLVERKRHEDCPLVEVPEPHGRLIDADELKTKHHWTDDYYETEYVEMEDVDNAPPVIEAEGDNGQTEEQEILSARKGEK